MRARAQFPAKPANKLQRPQMLKPAFSNGFVDGIALAWRAGMAT